MQKTIQLVGLWDALEKKAFVITGGMNPGEALRKMVEGRKWEKRQKDLDDTFLKYYTWDYGDLYRVPVEERIAHENRRTWADYAKRDDVARHDLGVNSNDVWDKVTRYLWSDPKKVRKDSLPVPFIEYMPDEKEVAEYIESNPRYRRYMAAMNPMWWRAISSAYGKGNGDLEGAARSLGRYMGNMSEEQKRRYLPKLTNAIVDALGGRKRGWYNNYYDVLNPGDSWWIFLHELGHYQGWQDAIRKGIHPHARHQAYDTSHQARYEIERDDSIRAAMLGEAATGIPYDTLIKGTSAGVGTYAQNLKADELRGMSPGLSLPDSIQKNRNFRYWVDSRFRMDDMMNQVVEDMDKFPTTV